MNARTNRNQYAVIFDIGGVLYQMHNTAAQQALEAAWGLVPGTLDKAVFGTAVAQRAMIGQANRQEMWAEAQRRLSLADAVMAQLQTVMLPDDVWDTALLEFAQSLRSRCQTAVLSDAWEGARESVAAYVHDGLFDAIVFSYEVGASKPDPRMYQAVLAQLQIHPHQAMFIDDRAHNVAGAQALGIHAVQFQSREQVITAVLDWLDTRNP
ncbi:MAG: HAD family phosphatase [Anaerolineae bacterium]|nr:HAD family phosphatase [Anaerolineae bacterium]